MSGIFLSYSRVDSGFGRQVISGLRALGLTCWWDQDMQGVSWQEELERKITQLGALVVIWTPASCSSKFVRAEAALALNADKLVNVLYGAPQPPFPFNGIHGLALDGWTGREPHHGWRLLVETLEQNLVKLGEVTPGRLTEALAKRERDIRRRQTALASAEEAHVVAQAAVGQADVAMAEAKTAATTAEDRLMRVGAMRGGPNLLKGAQADLEEARAVLQQAEQARRAAATSMTSASRALSRAHATLEGMFAPSEELVEPEPEAERVPAPPRLGWPAAFALLEAARRLIHRAMFPAWRPLAAGSVATIAIGLLAVFAFHSRPAPTASAFSLLAATPRPPADGLADATRELAGDWSGHLATCGRDPLRIAVDGTSILETLSDTPSTGTILGLDGDRAVRVSFGPDDTELYAVSGGRLVITAGGHSLSYDRCAG